MNRTGDSTTRLQTEREFHNAIHSDKQRAGVGRWYAAVRSGEQLQNDKVCLAAAEKIVLEYGCADGELSLRQLALPAIAREFHGIDISDHAIAEARQGAQARGYGNAYFHEMDAERMTFADGTFDLVFGRAILHHLDLAACFAEIVRVLKPGGLAIFYEPMGHNPLINWYRRRTPELRTPDEHPLVAADLRLAANFFSGIQVTAFGLTTLAAAAMPFPSLMRRMEGLDRFLFHSEKLRRQAWFELLELSR